uniref:ER membrane protein complex subunit 8 n=1 Tax=Canis lupus dingo TaxID=286419 RepID=A0A8C0QUY6_CANLU
MPGVKLTTQAYCKMVLHGAKYPHCAVNGLLVAEKQKPRKEHLPLGGPGAHHTLFVDCIPLFHGTLALAPMLEVALTLIDSWCKDNSYVIAGYYQANERVKDASPNQVAEKVASRIAEGFSDTALIMVSFSWVLSCFLLPGRLLSLLALTWSFIARVVFSADIPAGRCHPLWSPPGCRLRRRSVNATAATASSLSPQGEAVPLSGSHSGGSLCQHQHHLGTCQKCRFSGPSRWL